MLACAHVLAMDAKNLLDVVDSIRTRYPDLVLPAHLQPQPPSSPVKTTAVCPSIATVTTFQASSSSPPPPQIEENQYQNSQQLGLHHSSPPASLPAAPNNQTYSNQSGIYDNESIISQQIKNLEVVNSHQSKKEIIKPQPPIRSSGLVSKIRANFQPPENNRNNGAGGELNEPLKIVEDEMYSNAGIQLPEPVSCKIVQENLLPKNQVAGSSAK